MRYLIGLLALAVAACGSAGPTSTPAASGSLPEGRYFVQFVGYVAAASGGPVHLQIAFVDAFAEAPSETPEVMEIELETDRGPFPGYVDAITPNPPDGGYQLTSVLFHVDSLPVGTYHVTTLSFHDGTARHAGVSIGAWTIEVLDKASFHGLSERESSIQAPLFAQLETKVRNETDGPLTITGLQMALPNVQVKVSMFAPDSQATPDASGFQQTEDRQVTEVAVGPGEDQALRFRFDPPDVAPFIVLQPILQFRDANGVEGLMQVPLNVYSAPFPSTADMEAYLRSLPPSAITK